MEIIGNLETTYKSRYVILIRKQASLIHTSSNHNSRPMATSESSLFFSLLRIPFSASVVCVIEVTQAAQSISDHHIKKYRFFEAQ